MFLRKSAAATCSVFIALALFLSIFTGCPNDSGGDSVSDSVTSVSVAPATATIVQGGTQQFTANVEGTGDFTKTVVWTISGNSKAGTTINSAGLLTVASDEPVASKITVKAASTFDTSKSGSANVTLTEKVGVTSVSVTPATATGPLHLLLRKHGKMSVLSKKEGNNGYSMAERELEKDTGPASSLGEYSTQLNGYTGHRIGDPRVQRDGL